MAGSARAPLFYDSNDTGYYGDFASTSYFNVTGTNKMRADTNRQYGDNSGWWTHDPYGYGWGKPYGSFRSLEVSTSGNFSTEPAMFRIHQWGSGSCEWWKPQGTTVYLRETPGGGGSWFTRYVIERYAENTESFRAPIFYDTNNTGYYLDPNSISNLAHLRVTASTSGYSAMFGPYTLSTNGVTMVLADDNRYSVQVNAPYYPHLGVSAYANSGNTTHGPVISMTGFLTGGGYRRFMMGIANQNPDNCSFGWFNNESNPHYGVGINWSYPASVWYDTGNNWYARGSMRAPIFYDQDNTGRYMDPTGQSYIVNLCVGENNYNHAYPGVLQLGSTSYNYNFQNGSWAGAITCGILANCADEWEFMIHDSGTRVASAFLFQSGPNRFLMGRSTSWGTTYVEAAESSRAPIFYDSNNTAYYTDPNGNSYSNDHRFNRIGFPYSGNGPDGFPYARITEAWGLNFSPIYDTRWAPNVSNGSFLVGFISSGANFGNGNILATGNITAYYSDERLKDIISIIPNALDKVMSLRGFYYTNNELAKGFGYTDERVQLGVSAQEVEAVLPEVVTLAPFDICGDNDPINGDGKIYSKSGENYKTVDYSRLTPLLIEAMKELKGELDLARAEIKELKEAISKK
jgi:hypothetical protein